MVVVNNSADINTVDISAVHVHLKRAQMDDIKLYFYAPTVSDA